MLLGLNRLLILNGSSPRRRSVSTRRIRVIGSRIIRVVRFVTSLGTTWKVARSLVLGSIRWTLVAMFTIATPCLVRPLKSRMVRTKLNRCLFVPIMEYTVLVKRYIRLPLLRARRLLFPCGPLRNVRFSGKRKKVRTLGLALERFRVPLEDKTTQTHSPSPMTTKNSAQTSFCNIPLLR